MFSNFTAPALGTSFVISIAGVNDAPAYYINYTFSIVRSFCNISQIALVSDPAIYNSTQVLSGPGAWSTVAITQTPQPSVSLSVAQQGSCNMAMTKITYMNSTMLPCSGSVCPLTRGSNSYYVTAYNSDNSSVITTAYFNLTNIQINAYGAILNQDATQGIAYCNSYSLSAAAPYGYSSTLANVSSFPVTQAYVDYEVISNNAALSIESNIHITPCLSL